VLSKTAATYRGRFAPSPTGDLHFGSLLAALVSYCEAKSNSGYWHLRIEDLDTTRVVKGADKKIFKTLENYALYWDGPIIYQSHEQQQSRYQNALTKLSKKGLTYRCGCTRKELAGSKTYPGHCRLLPPANNKPSSIRLITQQQDFSFDDDYQGLQQQNIQQQCGDFNIKRKDGLFCYQLAVVVDDAYAEISHVVRGIDIMSSTARQLYLQQLLGFSTPQYAHFPVVTSADGAKLSKQNHAKAIGNENPYSTTVAALKLLNQVLPTSPLGNQNDLIKWAIDHWQPDKFQGLRQLPLR